VIQARQLERAFERLEERKVRVELIAFSAMRAVVCVHDGQDLVNVGYEAVVILVPKSS
jgi:hypothetical protein